MQYGSYRKDIVMFFSSIHADYTKMGYPAAIVRALDFLKNTDIQALPGGRHAIEGDMMYANVDDVETKLFETTKPESHKNYVDIQFMVKGEENMGFFVDHGRVKPTKRKSQSCNAAGKKSCAKPKKMPNNCSGNRMPR